MLGQPCHSSALNHTFKTSHICQCADLLKGMKICCGPKGKTNAMFLILFFNLSRPWRLYFGATLSARKSRWCFCQGRLSICALYVLWRIFSWIGTKSTSEAHDYRAQACHCRCQAGGRFSEVCWLSLSHFCPSLHLRKRGKRCTPGQKWVKIRLQQNIIL